MAANNSYTVRQRGLAHKASMLMACIFLGMIGIHLLVAEEPSIFLAVFTFVMLVLPFGLGAIWTGRYSIRVKGRSLTVQKSFRLKPVEIDMADITRAVYHVTETRIGVNTKLTVYTASCGKFSVETLMDNGEKFMELIKNSVSKDKIEVVHKSLVKK